MKHDDIRHMLSGYLDGSVTAGEKAEIEEHLKACPACGDALKELQKTVEHIKAIEEVDSPAWMTQKIMARVRAGEEKKGIFRKLFFPLHIKLPLEAVAVLFLAVTTYYISQEMKLAQAPLEKVMAEKEVPSSVTEEKGGPSAIVKDEALKQSRPLKESKSAQPPSMPSGGATPETTVTAKADRFAAAPAAPAPAEERAVKESESFAPAPAKKREAAPSAGFIRMDESRPQATAPRAKALAYAGKKEPEIHLTVNVKDLDAAGREIERAILQLKGKMIRTEAFENKKTFLVELGADKLKDLYEKLKSAGEVKEKDAPSVTQKGSVEIRVEIIKISIRE